MSQVPQEIKADDILMGIATANTPQASIPEPVTPEPAASAVVDPVVIQPVSTPEPVPAKSDGPSAISDPSKLEVLAPETIEDWDSEPNQPANIQEPVKTYDFSTIGKTLGIEVKSEDELVNEFKKLKEQNETLTKSSTNVDDLFASDTLKRANEIAKNNGDYLGFLGIAALDFDSISDIDLVEDEIRSNFPDTPESNQKIQSYIESLSEAEIEMRGNQIRHFRKHEQEREKSFILQDTESKKAIALKDKQLTDQKVADELAKLKDINGFALKPNHKKAIYDDITTGKMYEKLFFTDGKFDPNKAIRTLFVAEQHDKMVQYYKTRSKTDGKKEIISTITNAELNKPVSVVSAGEPKSAMDLYMDSLKQKR